MSAPTPRGKAIFDLLLAHRELSTLELLEFRQAMIAGAVWLACAALAGTAAWLAINASVLIALRERPLEGLGAVLGMNAVIALVAGLRARSVLGRPFFELTRQEASRDVRTALEAVT